MPEESFKCEFCDRIFGSKEALDMHKEAKHSVKHHTHHVQHKKKISGKKVRNWIIFLAIIGLIAWGIYASMPDSNGFDNLPANEINIGSHSNIALHIHSQLDININGQSFPIPANIGVGPGLMRPVHTHDGSGLIHIEGPYARDFTLGDFFLVWGKTFNSTCIFEHCTAPGVGAMEVFVDGVKNEQYENIILRDHQEIRIEYRPF